MSIVVPPFTGFVGPATSADAVPSTISDIWDWWEPSREAYANNDPLTGLTGQKGGNDMTDPVAGTAFRGVYLSNFLNGLGVARFTGADHLDLPVFPGGSGHTFLVVKIDNDPPVNSQASGLWDNSTIVDGGTRNTHYPFPDDNNIYETWGRSAASGRVTVGNPAASLASWRVYEVVSVAGEYTVKVDGTQIVTTGTNTPGWKATAGKLGASFDKETASLSGHVAGMYHANAKLSAGDRTNLIDYINDRFALSSS